MKDYNKLIFDLSKKGKHGYSLPKLDVEFEENLIPEKFLKTEDLKLPEVSEFEVVRHFTNLSDKNYGLDAGFYPLGSCTMKYNPKINERVTEDPQMTYLHPYQDDSNVQGALEMMNELEEKLSEISGMDYTTLQPSAGAHGELTGLMMIKAYHEKNGDHKRKYIVMPESAHGTNPSTAQVVGYEIIEVKSTPEGDLDIEELKTHLNDELAGFMVTNPSTLGLFEPNIKEIARLIHEAGGLLYYDGANMNAIMGKAKPGEMGFDVMHYNIHKTFSTPHGGGGPGSGAVGLKAKLRDFQPYPVISKKGDKYILDYDRPDSIGKVKSFFGNYGILLRAFTYVNTLGSVGIAKASETAVLNANYMMARLKKHYPVAIDRICKHEFVLEQPKHDTVSTLDIAKRILDYGYHPPTVYFPLIVHGAIMIEPTETESRETLDGFIDALISIKKEMETDPDLLLNAPHTTIIGRVDEGKAAREINVKYKG